MSVSASTTFAMNGARLTVKGMLGWCHALGDVTPETTLRFLAGGSAFAIPGVPVARDAAVIEAELDYAISSTATLSVSYAGQFSGDAIDQSLGANIAIRF